MDRQVKRYEEITKDIDGVWHKQCRQCLDWFPETLDYFAKRSANKGGLNTRCRKCQKEHDIEYYEKNRENIIEYNKKYYREHLEWRKQYDRDLRLGDNRVTYLARLKQYNKDNRDAARERFYKFLRENPEKSQEYREARAHKEHEISKQEWKNCKDYFDNQCAYCGLYLEDHLITYKGKPKHTDFHKEHLYNNGANDLSNCVPSCRDCNSEKYTHDFYEWYSEGNTKFSSERLDRISKWINGDYMPYKE